MRTVIDKATFCKEMKDKVCNLDWYRENGDALTVLPAGFYPHKRGVIFLDVGWCESSAHPIHLIKCDEIIKDEKYNEYFFYNDGKQVGRVECDIDNILPRFIRMWEAWQEYKKTERGKELASDENAEYFAMNEFD